MENLPSTTIKDSDYRNLWKRPGGTFAKLTGIAGICCLGYAFLKYALPFLVAATTNILILGSELIVIAVVAYVLMSKEFRHGLGLLWLQMMRKFYGLIVNIDPINILKNSINEMKQKMGTITQNVTKLRGLVVSLEKKMDIYKEEFEKNIELRNTLNGKLSKATDPNTAMQYKMELQLLNAKITSGQVKIQKQTTRIDTAKKYYDIMKKLEMASKFKIDKSEIQLNDLIDDYEQAKLSGSVIKSTMEIIKGNLTSSMEQEIAMVKVSDTINTNIAEINRLLDGSNDILVNFDLERDIDTKKADEIVKLFNDNGFDIFNDTPTTSYMGSLPEGEPEPVLVEAHSGESKSSNSGYFNM